MPTERQIEAAAQAVAERYFDLAWEKTTELDRNLWRFAAEKALEAAEAAAWRPIEEAPKDGKPIVATDGRLFFRTHWQAYYEKWPHEEGGPTYTHGWSAESDDKHFPWRPTHFLPAPPQDTEES